MLIVCQRIGLKFKKPDLLEFSHHKNEEFMKFDEYENDLVDVMSDETETKVLSICLYLRFLRVQRFYLAPCSFNGSYCDANSRINDSFLSVPVGGNFYAHIAFFSSQSIY